MKKEWSFEIFILKRNELTKIKQKSFKNDDKLLLHCTCVCIVYNNEKLKIKLS